MLEEIRSELEQTARIEDLRTRAEKLDLCLSWINDEIEDAELSPIEMRVVENIRKAHCREFIESISAYGNSGYAEAGPLANLFLHHVHIFGELDSDNPGVLGKASPFFHCVD